MNQSLFSFHLKYPLLKRLLVIGVVVLLTSCAVTVPPSEKIFVSEQQNRIYLSVPVSELMMIFPKGNLQRKEIQMGGSTNSPRYFLFADPADSLILSGWFEPASRFTSAKAMFDEWKAKPKAAPSLEPRDIVFKKIYGWDTVLFTNNFLTPARRHIRAHWIQDGTWIEVHISVKQDEEIKAIDFLNAITVSKFSLK